VASREVDVAELVAPAASRSIDTPAAAAEHGKGDLLAFLTREQLSTTTAGAR
jgi:hypothetical protein